VGSEVARLREQIELECGALQLALTGLRSQRNIYQYIFEPESTDIGVSLTNADPLCCPLREPLSQDPTCLSENYPSGKSASTTRTKETRVWYLSFGMAQCREPHP
jgi:hypothetical protein